VCSYRAALGKRTLAVVMISGGHLRLPLRLLQPEAIFSEVRRRLGGILKSQLDPFAQRGSNHPTPMHWPQSTESNNRPLPPHW
jgi:hypothetical protein